ncbi:MAG: hypothetical protein E7052_05655 [Lentisphaerae bacterium]|nr:hypothetical protein [Lentisphaerota bacterium]
MNNSSEIHLFCLWQYGIKYSDLVIAEIKTNFSILSVTDVTWQGQSNLQSLLRFYINPRWIIFWKYLRCGGAPVRMIVVRDDNPVYAERQTNSGSQLVNTKLFDTKIKLRKTLPNGHWIHATNSEFEFNFNYSMLMARSPELSELQQAPEWNGTVQKQITQAPGTRPWKDLQEMFDFIRGFDRYAVLRNFENLPHSCQLGIHSDIDILTDTPAELIRLLNLKRASYLPGRSVWRCRVADSFVNIDIRSPGDGYYPPEMTALLLQTSCWHNNVRVLTEENYFYSLCYHAAIHKYQLSEEYLQRLLTMAEYLDIKQPAGTDPKKFITQILWAWMQKNNFSFTEPKDLTVNYNSCYLPLGTSRTFKRQLKDKFFQLLGKKSRQ